MGRIVAGKTSPAKWDIVLCSCCQPTENLCRSLCRLGLRFRLRNERFPFSLHKNTLLYFIVIISRHCTDMRHIKLLIGTRAMMNHFEKPFEIPYPEQPDYHGQIIYYCQSIVRKFRVFVSRFLSVFFLCFYAFMLITILTLFIILHKQLYKSGKQPWRITHTGYDFIEQSNCSKWAEV